MSAHIVYDNAPLGSLIRYSDCTPKPPARFTRKSKPMSPASGRVPAPLIVDRPFRFLQISGKWCSARPHNSNSCWPCSRSSSAMPRPADRRRRNGWTRPNGRSHAAKRSSRAPAIQLNPEMRRTCHHSRPRPQQLSDAASCRRRRQPRANGMRRRGDRAAALCNLRSRAGGRGLRVHAVRSSCRRQSL